MANKSTKTTVRGGRGFSAKTSGPATIHVNFEDPHAVIESEHQVTIDLSGELRPDKVEVTAGESGNG